MSPFSFMAKWLQAKYFHHGDFLSASLGRRPFYLWQSLLKRENLLSLGICSCVGNGLFTNIYSKWIPSLQGNTPSSFFLARSSERQVLDLIDFNQNCWREYCIRHLFLHHKVEAILQSPLNPTWPFDRIIWHHTPNSIYIVNSGYKVRMNHRRSMSINDGSSNSIMESFT